MSAFLPKLLLFPISPPKKQQYPRPHPETQQPRCLPSVMLLEAAKSTPPLEEATFKYALVIKLLRYPDDIDTLIIPKTFWVFAGTMGDKVISRLKSKLSTHA